MRGLLEVTILVDLVGEIIREGANASIGKHVVNSTVDLLGLLEQRQQVRPHGDVGLNKGEARGALGRCLDVAVDNQSSQGQQLVNSGQADAG